MCRATKNCFQGYNGVGIFLGKMLLTVDLLASFLWGHFASNFAQVRRDYSQYGAIHSSNMAFDVGRLNFKAILKLSVKYLEGTVNCYLTL